jgi:hypothetical protein
MDLKTDREFTSKIDDKIMEIRGGFEMTNINFSECFRGRMGPYKDMMADPIANVDEPLYLQLETA